MLENSQNRASFLLTVFLPLSIGLWFFPLAMLSALVLALVIFLIKRKGLSSVLHFLKFWGVLALFWVLFSTFVSLISKEASLESLFNGALLLFFRLVTLFLLTFVLSKETTPVSLARAVSGIVSACSQGLATKVGLAILFVRVALTRKKKAFSGFRSALKSRFPEKGLLFRLKLLLPRLVEDTYLASELASFGVLSRGLEKDVVWEGGFQMNKKERTLAIFLLALVCALFYLL